MGERLAVSPETLADLLTRDRLKSYIAVTGELRDALALYEWIVDASAASLATCAAVEVLVRNSLDAALIDRKSVV